MPGILAQAPRPSLVLVRPQMHHIARTDGPRARGRLDHQAAGIVDGAGPARELLARQGHPHLLAERGAAPPHLVGQGPPPGARLRAAHTGVPGPPGGGRRRTWRSTGRAGVRRPGRCRPPRAGPGQATLIPMPTTTAVRVAPANSASARTPASLAPSSSRSLGHLRTGSTPATARQASAPARATAPAHRWTSSAADSRAGGAPRPAGSPPAATPSGGRAGPARPSGGRPPRRARRGPRGGPVTHVGVGGIDLAEPVDVPVPPHMADTIGCVQL